MRIIKATETIAVEHPVVLIFGQPGICKTSLAYSANEPLLIDADQGSHRAVNRRDTLAVQSWTDVNELSENSGALEAYLTVVPDTVGRVLDLMVADIIEKNPKYARDGALTQQGWGVLKTRFRTWITLLRSLGKDVILIAHQKEEKDGDVTVVRPDIVGGSYGEVMKIADFVGYIYMVGKDRVLDFNPTDRWVGKNPGAWPPFKVPPVGKATTFLADLMEKGRAALGNISEASAKLTQQVDDWRSAIEAYANVEELNRGLAEIQKAKLSPIADPQVKKLLLERAKVLRCTFDREKAAFVPPVQPVTPPAASDIFAGIS